MRYEEIKNLREGWTTVALRRSTVSLLKELGKKGESYDDIVRKLLEKMGISSMESQREAPTTGG